MKKIGDRIKYEKPSKDELLLEISPKVEKQKIQILMLWTIAFTICGLIIFSALFFHDFKDTGEFLLVVIFLLFWGYFEFKVLYALRWNKQGKEVVIIKNAKFSYVQQISKTGIPVEVDIVQMKPFAVVKEEDGFWNEINNSIFIVGGEVIEYRSGESIKRLGLKLNQKDALQLVTLLNKTAKF